MRWGMLYEADKVQEIGVLRLDFEVYGGKLMEIGKNWQYFSLVRVLFVFFLWNDIILIIPALFKKTEKTDGFCFEKPVHSQFLN